ncbi:hypothetical protein BV22DRAFT_863188 [Leucogyrophana mollusca]|uniref:Uncharacterized protein n=1 Tax=Leucogyrophana mollusca TaxID=85980 RepID=A0ACB8B2C0_9AGAM|nr:hypothetical protein BV22DRAFT_863188 [Leucogyrophana mollusca]
MSTTTTTVYTETIRKGYGTGLNPLSLLIDFCGNMDSRIALASRIPLQISISIPDEFSEYVVPVLGGIPIADLADPLGDIPPPQVTLPFLPLPLSFHPSHSLSWATLAKDIEFWLIHSIIDTQTDDWRWNREFFWMSYIAAYPQFPRGNWPIWDAKIAMEGDFLSHWTEISGGNLPREGSIMSIREIIWDEFQQLASHVFPHPIVPEYLT